MKNFLKITLLIASFFLLLSSTLTNESISISIETEESSYSQGDEFKKGWDIGWCEGWKDIKGEYAYCPYPPYPPYPKYGKDTYRGGYNAAFKYGRCKAEGYENCKKN